MSEIDELLKRCQPLDHFREIRPPANSHWTKRYLGLEVVGDSMSPYIEEGDIVIFETSAAAKAGQIVVAQTPDGLACKYLYYSAGGVLLRPHNDDFEEQFYDAQDITIRGVVVRIERDIK